MSEIVILHESETHRALWKEGSIVVEGIKRKDALSFSSWRDLASFLSAVVLKPVDEIKAARQALFAPDIAAFGRWLPHPGSPRSRSQREAFGLLFELNLGPSRLLEVQGRLGVEIFEEEGSLSIVDQESSYKTVFSPEELVLLVCLVLGDERTDSEFATHYAPFLLTEIDLDGTTPRERSVSVEPHGSSEGGQLEVSRPMVPTPDSPFDPVTLIDEDALRGRLEGILAEVGLVRRR